MTILVFDLRCVSVSWLLIKLVMNWSTTLVFRRPWYISAALSAQQAYQIRNDFSKTNESVLTRCGQHQGPPSCASRGSSAFIWSFSLAISVDSFPPYVKKADLNKRDIGISRKSCGVESLKTSVLVQALLCTDCSPPMLNTMHSSVFSCIMGMPNLCGAPAN